MNWNNEKLVEVLRSGGVAVMPTDTLYGIVGSALDQKTVERTYSARKRNPEKPCIILIASIDDLQKFGVVPTETKKEKIAQFKVPTSFILDCLEDKFEYLHRGTKTLAFRIPNVKELRNLLVKTGPLIAPSANIEGQSPAKNIVEAENYFGDLVDLYVDGGEIIGKASQVIRLHKNGTAEILRK